MALTSRNLATLVLLAVLASMTAQSWAQNAQRASSPSRNPHGGPASHTRSHSPSRGGAADARTDRRRRPERPRTPAGSPNATYDYFILSQQWSPGICAIEPQVPTIFVSSGAPEYAPSNHSASRRARKNYWTIHGLWPAGDNTSPSFCVDEQFNGRVLDPIKRDLNKYWPSLTSAEARYFTFWRHQWQKHGTCAGDYNIFEFLSNSLIRPSVVRTYSAAEIRNALSDDIRQKVNIVCSQRVQNRDAPVLTEIRFCLDKNLEPVNCQGKNGGCGRRNYYLPSRP
ncbi:hypothetical protein MRX96_044555 [Rhipicephalus microplus]